MNNERSTGYWVTAVIVVLAIAAVAWWYTASSTPLVPNTGTESASSSALDYTAE